MNNRHTTDDNDINGFFTKIVSLMVICSVFVSSVDAMPAQARVYTDAPSEKADIILDEVYLESNIVSLSGYTSIFGSTLPEAALEVTYPDGGTHTATADVTGYFNLSGLPLMNAGDSVDITASTGNVKMSEHLQLGR